VFVGLGFAVGSVWLISIGALVTVAGTTAALSSRFALHRLSYTRRLSSSRVFAGESVDLALRLANDKLLPLAWVRVVDNVPEGLDFGERELTASTSARRRRLAHLASLRPYEHVTWRYRVECPKRGHYLFGPVQLDTGDLFGLYDTSLVDPQPMRLVVYPKVRPLRELGFPAGEPFGGRRSSQPLLRDPLRPIGVRDYRPEDGWRQVHWKATARLGELKVKVLEPVSQEAIVIVLNGATFDRSFIGIDPERQEQVISVAASIAAHADGLGYAVGLAANGAVPGSGRPIRVPANRGPDALSRVLGALAAVTSFINIPVTRLLASEGRRAPWGATIVVVSVLVREDLEREVLRQRRAGRRIALVSLDEDYDGAVPGVPTHHISPESVLYAREVA
jgi:uncharacterized protein (DUF58 family)